MKIAIIGTGNPEERTLIEALVMGVEEKTGEKVEIVQVHEKDLKVLTTQLPQIDKEPITLIAPTIMELTSVPPSEKRKGHERPYKYHR